LTHFSFASNQSSINLENLSFPVDSENGAFNDYGGGSYTLEGNQYTEYMDFSTYEEYWAKQ
jgi:hypothetical protein